jgi:SecD/SecF fusion protein
MGRRRRSLLVLALVLGLTAASAIVISSKRTVLGLDLRGGTQLIYQGEETARTPNITPDDIDRAIDIIRERADKLGVSEPEISRIGEKGIQVGLPDVQNAEQAIEQIGTTSQLYFYDFEANVVPPPGPNVPDDPTQPPGPINPSIYQFPNLFDAVEFASKRKPECFEDQCTTKGPTYYLFERDSHLLLAGPAAQKKDLFLQFRDEKRPPGSQIIAVPQGTVVVQAESEDPTLSQSPEEVSTTPHYVFKDRPALSGDDIENPEQQFDPTTNQPNVTFDFTDKGRAAFQDITQTIAQRGAASAPPGAVSGAAADQYSQHFSVVLDGQVVTQPIINFNENPSGIDGRTGAQISGSFTISTAQDLAEFLRIGALPINLQLESQSTVSATLGQQALDQGLRAGVIGLFLVVCFLIAYYRMLGVIATVGLAVYGVIFFALVKLIPITLTLPGIAGLILTIGVAADANIVIFERIKEEARAGRSMMSAIGQGYRKGIATIIDANVITLFTAFILFVLATSGVKGFAFTLGVGTIVSLLTAVLFTQAILGSLGRSRILHSPRALGAGEQRVRWRFDFSGASRWFFSISGVILVIGAIAFATKQLNLGIDFTSGAKITAGLQQPASVDEVRQALTDAGVTNASSAEIQTVANDKLGPNVIEIQGKIPLEEVTGEGRAPPLVRNTLENEFGFRGGSEGFNSTTVGPTFGAQVARSAVIAIIFSLLVISAYVAIRFEAKYAIPVLIAITHDILITGGIYSLTGREVTSGTVAAFLTILGYSIYDTVIVFDRIRENVPRLPRAAFSQIANKSMSEVLTRSLITGLSTVFLITVLFVFGGATLKDFAFAMGVGVLSGTYSSIFIATPVLTHWKEREPAYRARRAHLIDEMGQVPTFPEDNVVAKVGPDGEPPRPAPEPAEPEPQPVEPAPVEPVGAVAAGSQTGQTGDDGADADEGPEPEPLATAAPGEPGQPARPERQRKRRQQRRRRKHGRHR